MVLDHLALLDASMRASDCRAVRFLLRCQGTPFSVVYLNDVCPQELLVFRLEPRRWIRLLVQTGHQLEPLAVRPLVEVDFAADSPASPEVRWFLDEFALSLPKSLAEVERAAPELILQHSPDVEDAAKVFFTGWSPLNGAARPNHPALQKTRRAFGQDVYELCLHLHLTGQWSDDAGQKVPFKLPE